MNRRSAGAASWIAFRALVGRDLAVLRQTIKQFLPRVILQPLLLMFVFTYVFPKIGQGIGGANHQFSTLLMAGVVATAMFFQGVQGVALPLVQEFGFTREIEDRIMAPAPLWVVAASKVASGALQTMLAGLIVFPIGLFVPADTIHLHINWLILLTLAPLVAICAASFGMFFGTRFEARQLPVLFGIIVVPITFLGCTYYPWQALRPIRWLQVAVLINPLMYFAEGFRAALTRSPHISLLVIYPALVAFTAVLAWTGFRQFRNRVMS